MIDNYSNTFATEVEKIVNHYQTTYMDAIIIHCENSGIEIESIPSLIKSNTTIKAKLQEEGEALNLLPKISRLPI